MHLIYQQKYSLFFISHVQFSDIFGWFFTNFITKYNVAYMIILIIK